MVSLHTEMDSAYKSSLFVSSLPRMQTVHLLSFFRKECSFLREILWGFHDQNTLLGHTINQINPVQKDISLMQMMLLLKLATINITVLVIAIYTHKPGQTNTGIR